MSESARVQNIQTISDLSDALCRLANEAQDAVRSGSGEIARAQEWVQQRVWYWQRQLQQAQQQWRQARDTLNRCQTQISVDRNGRRHEPDCRNEERAVRDAERQVREMEALLRQAQKGRAQIESIAADYRRSAGRLQQLAESHTPRARAFLEQARADLENYLAVSPPSSAAAAAYREMRRRTAGASSSVRGTEFEHWTQEHVFGGKRRITVPPELNAHLIDVDEDGLGIDTRRTSDNYVGEDGSLWDDKAYNERSRIDEEQLRDYSLMERAGYVYDSNGNQVRVTSVNYLFIDRSSAAANAWRLQGMATPWYVDDAGDLHVLEE